MKSDRFLSLLVYKCQNMEGLRYQEWSNLLQFRKMLLFNKSKWSKIYKALCNITNRLSHKWTNQALRLLNSILFSNQFNLQFKFHSQLFKISQPFLKCLLIKDLALFKNNSLKSKVFKFQLKKLNLRKLQKRNKTLLKISKIRNLSSL